MGVGHGLTKFPGSKGGQMGRHTGCCGEGSGSSMAQYDVTWTCPSIVKNKMGGKQESKGNVPADMVGLQGKTKINWSPWAKTLNTIRIRIL